MRLIASTLAICLAFSVPAERAAADPSSTSSSPVADSNPVADAAPIAQSDSPSTAPTAAVAENGAPAQPATDVAIPPPAVAAASQPPAVISTPREIDRPARKTIRARQAACPPTAPARHRHIVKKTVPAPRVSQDVFFERPKPETVAGSTSKRCDIISCPRFVLLGVAY